MLAAPRTLPLFDDAVHPSSWNERMAAGEYAVHESNSDAAQGVLLVCTVFDSLVDADVWARQQVAERPGLRCRIYDHQGFVGAPVREIRGSAYKGEGEVSRRFRRWVGTILFFGGLLLIGTDWHYDFELSWPAMLGSRMLVPGVILLLTEAMIVLYATRKSAYADETRPR